MNQPVQQSSDLPAMNSGVLQDIENAIGGAAFSEIADLLPKLFAATQVVVDQPSSDIGFSRMALAPIDGTAVLLYMPTTADKFAVGQFYADNSDSIRGNWGDDEGNYYVHEPVGWMGLHVLAKIAESASNAGKASSETWRPIATAPKDGTWVLCGICGIHPDFGTPFVPGVARLTGDGWQINDFADFMEYQPTHWMPLPEAPDSIVAPSEPAVAEAVRPDILEKLTYHKYECDDLTLDEALSYLAEGWKKVHGRTERQMIFQIVRLLASTPAITPEL